MNESVHDNPYAAPVAAVADAPAVGLELAERSTRLGAALLDGLFFGLAYIPIIVIAAASAGPSANETTAYWVLGAGGVAILAVLVVNCVLLHRSGQTIAKKLLGIKVLRGDGSRASLARIIFMRILPTGVLGVIPLVGPVVSLVDSLLIFRDDRRCLHDQIADTVVVKA